MATAMSLALYNFIATLILLFLHAPVWLFLIIYGTSLFIVLGFLELCWFINRIRGRR